MKSLTHLPHELAAWRAGSLLIAATWGILLAAPAAAQIRTDASLVHPAQTLSGPNYLIPQTLGKQAGNNLFHSFQTFNLQTGESALFTTSSPGIANVITRVTGGSASTIAGQLRLQAAGGGSPSFFFINPAGVTFGAGASVDVPGAFYVSTAQYIKFSDGNFNADTATPSTFSTASPEAFGFLAGGRATVQAINTNPQGTPGQPARPSLFVGTDKAIHIVAGDVKIDNSVIGNESGDVRIVALGRPSQDAEVALSGAHPGASGDLTIRNGGQINSSTNSNKDVGSVAVYAGDILIDKNGATRDTGIISQADRGASGRTGQLTVIATGDLTLLNGAKISASNSAVSTDPAAATPGRLTVMARNISLDGSEITAESRGNVDASSIRVAATGSQASPVDVADFERSGFTATGNLTLANGASINGNTYLSGKGASIAVKAGTLALAGGGKPTLIVASTLNQNVPGQTQPLPATGDGGSIDIMANAVSLTNGGQIQSSTITQGKAGAISVQAGSMSIDGQNGPSQTGIFGTANPGSGGQAATVDINLGAGALVVTRRGAISVQNDATASPAQLAGLSPSSLTIAAGSIQMDNGALISASTSGNVEASRIDLRALGNVSLDNGAAIQGTTTGSGNGSSIAVTAGGDLSLSNGAYINGNTSFTGQAASVSVAAANVTLDGKGTSAIISSEANARQGADGATGSGNLVDISTPGLLTIANGGQLKSSTNTAGNAGKIRVRAGDVDIDGQDNTGVQTGIINTTIRSGNSGEIDVVASGAVRLRQLGEINASAYGPAGRAGAIRIESGSLVVDGMKEFHGTQTLPDGTLRAIDGFKSSAISSEAGSNSAGQTGDVTVSVTGSMSVSNGAKISVSNLANVADPSPLNGAPDDQKPSLNISAGSLSVDSRGMITASTSGNVNASRIAVTTATGDVELKNGATLQASTNGAGNAGAIAVNAGGNLVVTAGGNILDSTSGAGHAGSVRVRANEIVIDGQTQLQTGIFSAANQGATGNAGEVMVAAQGDLTLRGGGQLSVQNDARTIGATLPVPTSGGTINLQTGNSGTIIVNSVGSVFTSGGATINVSKGSTSGTSNAGAIAMNSGGGIIVNSGGGIVVATSGTNSAGSNIRLSAASQRPARSNARSASASTVSPSTLLVLARNISLSGDQTQITAASSGNMDASQIKIAALGSAVPEGTPDFAALKATGNLSVGKGSSINGNTSGSGRGAPITIKAGTVTLDGSGGIASISSESMPSPRPSAPATTGDGGSVEITASRLVLSNGGQIKTSTATAGNAGVATLAADSILIDGANNPQVLTGIIGSTNSAGDSGKISVSATQDLSIVRLGQISASTNGAGRAGNIAVQGGTVRIDGKLKGGDRTYASNISAEAGPASSGRTGNLTVDATRRITLSNGGKLSVQNYANVSPAAAAVLNDSAAERPRIGVSAPDITLIDAQISAASTGNVNASNIDIAFSNKLYLDPSAISTSANSGDGGAIDIRGGRLMVLENSVVSTSVTGLVGFNGNPANGGDIHVTAENLLLQSGFIQANTAASNASGGNVTLALNNLVPSGNTLYLGGQTAYSFTPYVFGFNVIQAAAPTGISGTIQISSPTLDLAGALSGLKAKMVDTGGLGRSPCQASAGSSFVQAGRGGFAPSARELLGPASPISPAEPAGMLKPVSFSRLNVECDQR